MEKEMKSEGEKTKNMFYTEETGFIHTHSIYLDTFKNKYIS